MHLKNMIQELMSEEIPVYTGKKHAIIKAFMWGALIFSILTFIRPFGLSDENLLMLFFSNAGFGVIIAFSTTINYGFVRKKFSGNENARWQLNDEVKNAGLLLLIVVLCNFLYSSLVLSHVSYSISGALQTFLYTTALFLPLIIADLLCGIVTRYRKKVLILKTKNEYLHDLSALYSNNDKHSEKISLTLENETVAFERNKLLGISSYGNYLRIIIAASPRIIEVVKRATLKELESQLQPYPEFFRCHRSHIINLTCVTSVTGTNKKTSVNLGHGKVIIPVTRSSIATVKKRLAAATSGQFIP